MQNFAESITKRIEPCPEKSSHEDINLPKGLQDFFEALEEYVRDAVRMVIEKAINEEFQSYIGCFPYQRS